MRITEPAGPPISTAFGPHLQNAVNHFDFTLLFEQSIFSIGPDALFLLLFPFRLARLIHETSKAPRTVLLGAKIVQ